MVARVVVVLVVVELEKMFSGEEILCVANLQFLWQESVKMVECAPISSKKFVLSAVRLPVCRYVSQKVEIQVNTSHDAYSTLVQ